MKPKKPANKHRQRELFRVELIQIIDPGHGLVILANAVDWDKLDEVFGKTYCPDNGRPAISTRLMVSLHYLKYTHNLSDDDVVTGWVENPYWQFLSGMQWFEHKMPMHPSSMSRWRKRVGDAGAEQLLKQTIEAGLKLKAVLISMICDPSFYL
jgi:transposase, IS5 family